MSFLHLTIVNNAAVRVQVSLKDLNFIFMERRKYFLCHKLLISLQTTADWTRRETLQKGTQSAGTSYIVSYQENILKDLTEPGRFILLGF